VLVPSDEYMDTAPELPEDEVPEYMLTSPLVLPSPEERYKCPEAAFADDPECTDTSPEPPVGAFP